MDVRTNSSFFIKCVLQNEKNLLRNQKLGFKGWERRVVSWTKILSNDAQLLLGLYFSKQVAWICCIDGNIWISMSNEQLLWSSKQEYRINNKRFTMITWPTEGGLVNGLCTTISINAQSLVSHMTNNTFKVNDSNTYGLGLGGKGPMASLVNDFCIIILIDDHA